MTNPDFQTTAHGKWILTGEHAVLRQGAALVFPVPTRYLKLNYFKSSEPLHTEFHGPWGEPLGLMFRGLLDNALDLVNRTANDIKGHCVLDNNIPIGAGMGFSAALCVVIGRWLIWHDWLQEPDLFEFARRLEDHFHGKSSGVDIAGTIFNRGIKFKRGKRFQPITLSWQPKLYLSFCDRMSVTSEAIEQVAALWQKDKTKAKQIDAQMQRSVALAEEALSTTAERGQTLLKQSIELGNDCFDQWGLLQSEMNQHIEHLKKAGAVACKPTGAGNGGFILSLFDSSPLQQTPKSTAFELIPIFEGQHV